MLFVRQLILLQRIPVRFYASKKIKMNDKDMLKQVHYETLRYVNPYAQFNICSDIYVKVRPANVHEYPDANVLIAELHGGHVKNCTASMQVKVSDDEKMVDVIVKKLASSTDFHCELEVPVRANLCIDSQDAVNVSSMMCDNIFVKSNGNIATNNIRATAILLSSQEGNVHCSGLLLGQNTQILTNGVGAIALDKLQGDNLICKTVEGNIAVNSCYVVNSKFETDNGRLDLKNIHKNASVNVCKRGSLNMSGVHGNIKIYSNGGDINLQLSEIVGESSIKAVGNDLASINISDSIEESVFIEISSANILLDSALQHFADYLSEDRKQLSLVNGEKTQNKLTIALNGALKLGKSSWMDVIQASLVNSKQN